MVRSLASGLYGSQTLIYFQFLWIKLPVYSLFVAEDVSRNVKPTGSDRRRLYTQANLADWSPIKFKREHCLNRI